MKDIFTQFIAGLNTFDKDEINALAEPTEVASFKKGSIILEEGQIRTVFILTGK